MERAKQRIDAWESKKSLDSRKMREASHRKQISIRREKFISSKRKKIMGKSSMEQKWTEDTLADSCKRAFDDTVPVSERVKAIVHVRQALSFSESAVEAAVKLRLPPMLDALMHEDNDELKLEGAWCITNIAASEFAEEVLPALPSLMSLLKSGKTELMEQAAWGIGNLAWDSLAARMELIDAGAPEALTKCCGTKNEEMLFNCLWALGALMVSVKDISAFVSAGLPAYVLTILKRPSASDRILIETVRLLSYLTAKDDDVIEFICRHSVGARLHEMMCDLGKKSPDFLIASLRVLGNILSGPQPFVDALNSQVPTLFSTLAGILRSEDEGSVAAAREVCWAISNAAIGSANQIEALIAQDIPKLLYKYLVAGAYYVRAEAAIALRNIAVCNNAAFLQSCNPEQVIPAMFDLIEGDNLDAASACLHFIDVFLDKTGKPELEWLESRGLPDLLERVAMTRAAGAAAGTVEEPSNSIAKQAMFVFNKHFDARDEDSTEEEDMPPMEATLPPANAGRGRGRGVVKPHWLDTEGHAP